MSEYSENHPVQAEVYADVAQQKSLASQVSLSPLSQELDKLHTLVGILENTFDTQQVKLSPLITNQDTPESLKEGTEDWNPIYDTQAGKALRELEWRITTLTDRIARTTRDVQV